MSSTVLRREGDTVHLEHKYYGKFKFREAAALADAAAASALVFAGERTDGCVAPPALPLSASLSRAAPRRAAADVPTQRRAHARGRQVRQRQPGARCFRFRSSRRLAAGSRAPQVYNDHMQWRDLYHNEATRFPGLPWILAQTIPEAPWTDGRKVDVMISQLLGDSLETVRLRSPQVRARAAASWRSGLTAPDDGCAAHAAAARRVLRGDPDARHAGRHAQGRHRAPRHQARKPAGTAAE